MIARVHDLVRRHGWNATSFQVLGPGFHYWFGDDGDSVVAYVEAGGCRVVAGAPICSPAALPAVAASFAADARAAGRRVVYFACEERLLSHLGAPYDAMRIGLQATWDPRRWSENIPSTVASQVRRASRKGVAVTEIDGNQPDPALGTQMRALVAHWNERHRMAPMQFLVALECLSYTAEHRYFVALRHGTLVGLLVAIPVYARGGWLLENLIVDRRAPNGTGEALVDTAMRHFEAENVPYATMGLVALAGLDAAPNGPGRVRKTILNGVLRRSYHQLNGLYGFKGLYAFRSRFKPQTWEPIYMAANMPMGVRALIAVLLAFMGDRPVAFALNTLDRLLHRILRPSPREVWAGISAFLAAALIPWILALLSSDSRYWFGNEWLSRAWASFDVPVALAFGALAVAVHQARPWARPLARLLLGIVSADCWLTTAQALLYNLPHLRSRADGLVVALAVAAPLCAAIYLGLLIRFVNLEQADDDD